jgi:hypothetical protein
MDMEIRGMDDLGRNGVDPSMLRNIYQRASRHTRRARRERRGRQLRQRVH